MDSNRHLRDDEIEALLGVDWDCSDMEEDDELDIVADKIVEGQITVQEFLAVQEENEEELIRQVEENLQILPEPSSSVAAEAAEAAVATDTSERPTTKRKYKWKKVPFYAPDVQWKGSLPPPPDEELSALDYFKMFFSDDMVKNIMMETNKYAHQKNNVLLDITTHEIECYISILLQMGLVKMASYRMYWANDCRYPPIADALSRNRFEAIKQNIHYNDNAAQPARGHDDYDKLYKVRPLLEGLRDNLKKIPPDEKHSVDEQIIPFKGRSNLKQYNKSKPHKWGFKVFTRASCTGIIHDFAVYVGSGTCPTANLGVSGDVVVHLTNSLQQDQNFKIYFDNWFSSLHLVEHLKGKGMWCVGTIRSDRMGKCPLLSELELKKNGRGSFDYRVENDSNLIVVRWLDKKAIQLVSSYCGAEPTDKCKRFSQKDKEHIEVTRPNIVSEYNKFMGGVDLADMLIELYRIDLRSKKWYTRIVYWCINVSVVNAWLLYRRHQSQKGEKKVMSLLKMQAEIANMLVSYKKINISKRGRPSSSNVEVKKKRAANEGQPAASIRLDNVGHLPEYAYVIDDSKRCKLCAKERVRCKECSAQLCKKRCKLCSKGVTTVRCIKCNVHLCFTPTRNCFTTYHNK